MKITTDTLKDKLAKGWTLIDSSGCKNCLSKKARSQDLDIDVIINEKDDNMIQIIADGTTTGDLVPVCLVHPDNETKVIAIDKVVYPKHEVKKKYARVIVFDSYSDTNHLLAAYIIYKTIKKYGFCNTIVDEFKWVDFERNQGKYFEDKNTVNICVGYTSSIHPECKNAIKIAPIRYDWHIEGKVGGIISKLKSADIQPEISVEDEKDKLIRLLSYKTENNYNLDHFLHGHLRYFNMNGLAICFGNPNYIGTKCMDKFMESAGTVEISEIKDLSMFIKNAKKHDVDEVHEYIMIDNIMVKSKDVVEIRPNERIHRCHPYGILASFRKVSRKLYPELPILLGNDTYIEVYVKKDLDLEKSLKRITNGLVSAQKNLKSIKIYLED